MTKPEAIKYTIPAPCLKRYAEIDERLRRLESGIPQPVSLPCQRLHPQAKLPAKAGPEEIGWDICCVADDVFSEDIAPGLCMLLDPGESHLFHTGFACAIDPGYAVLFFDRSGMGGKKNIHRLAGVIDCTYRGEWRVSLINLSKKPHIISEGDKIVQGIIVRDIPGVTYWVDQLPESRRGTAGFGSTGA